MAIAYKVDRPLKVCSECGKIINYRSKLRCKECNHKYFKKMLPEYHKTMRYVSPMLGKTHSPFSIAKIRNTIRERGIHKGIRNRNWKGGITPLRDLIRSLSEAKTWRKEIFARDDYTCQDCGTKSSKGLKVYLSAHHKKNFNVIFQEFLQEYNQFSPIEDKETLLRLAINYKPFWDIGNGKTLCNDCHYLMKGVEAK